MIHYCCSDLHGDYKLWKQIKKKLIKEDAVLYFLGDAIDRGRNGYRIMKEMLDNPRVIYLKGNHEQMFIDWAFEYLKNSDEINTLQSLQYLHCQNGGEYIQKDWVKDGSPKDILIALNNLDYYIVYENPQGIKIMLNHSGFPYNPKEELTIEKKDLILWDRSHCAYSLPGDVPYNYIIHGHTPIPYLSRKEIDFFAPSIYVYANGKKADIDMATDSSNMTCLINLDTFEITYLATDKKEN